MTKSEKLAKLRKPIEKRIVRAKMTIAEFACLPEQEQEVARIDCPYCRKELVGKLFCNPIHSERYRARCRRWDRKLAKERPEPQTATERDLNEFGFVELHIPEPEPELPRYPGTLMRRFGVEQAN